MFYSEDDFKLSLGFQLYKSLSNGSDKFNIYLERPENISYWTRTDKENKKRIYLDMMIKLNGDLYPIELKYRTTTLKNNHFNNGLIDLKDQGACDQGRYQFRKDIYRLERLTEKYKKSGFAIFLTNDKKYWEEKMSFDYIDSHYRFNKIIKKKDRGWNYDSKYSEQKEFDDKTSKYKNKSGKTHWTCESEYFNKLDLKNDYNIKWETYSESHGDIFRYMIVEVG